jgi:spore germination protein GerM
MNLNEQDERVLGQMLRRATESQPMRETPFHRSRLAAELERRPTRFGLWQFAAAAATLVLAAGAGLYLTNLRPTVPVATTPTPTTNPAPTPTPTQTAQATPLPGKLDHQLVYFARDRLPPTARHVDGAGLGETPSDRIRSRLQALATATSSRSDEVNAVASSKAVVGSVSVSGHVATVDYNVPGGDWGLNGAATIDAFAEQIVFTASEEPGVREVLITQNGGQQAVIGGEGLIVDEPLSREDVFDYEQPGRLETIDSEGDARSVTVTTDRSVDSLTGGLARFVIKFPAGERWMPHVKATMTANDERANPDLGKYVLTIEVPGARDTTTREQLVERTPLRAVYTSTSGALRYQLALDDLRPWRIAYLIDPVRIVVDIGGEPGTIAGGTAVYSPRPGASVDRTFTVSGLARKFEANVVWRVKDSDGRVLAQGHTTASIGTSPVWGNYEFSVSLPSSAAGNVTLEVFEASARDGSDEDLVVIPLGLR